ncbi:MAG TPA: hypothetical protein VNH22_14440 [Blastocatellia bacterium]|jgi:hypothetical protein|nr:hypothetical protein [Blastocatellia bacterium]
MREKVPGALIGFIGSSSALIVSIIGITWLLETQELATPARVGLALLPPAIYVISLVFLLRLLRDVDEFLQRVHLEALAIAFTALAVAVMTCEYLRKAGMISHLKPDHVLMMMMAVLLVGYLIAWRRYQ